MLFLIDRTNGKLFIARVISWGRDVDTYIVRKYEVLSGEQRSDELYRTYRSVKTDREWVDAIFTYYKL